MVSFAAPAPKPLPDVAIPTTKGQVITFKRYRGKVMIVALISTTCKKCLDTVQILEKMQADLGPKGFQAVAAAIEPNAKFMVNGLINRYRLSYPVGYLEKDPAFKLAGLPATGRPFVPIILVVNRQGQLVLQLFGDSPLLKTEDNSLRGIVNNYLREGAAAAPAQTKAPSPETAPDSPPSPDKP